MVRILLGGCVADRIIVDANGFARASWRQSGGKRPGRGGDGPSFAISYPLRDGSEPHSVFPVDGIL